MRDAPRGSRGLMRIWAKTKIKSFIQTPSEQLFAYHVINFLSQQEIFYSKMEEIETKSSGLAIAHYELGMKHKI